MDIISDTDDIGLLRVLGLIAYRAAFTAYCESSYTFHGVNQRMMEALSDIQKSLD
jgi:hypothetical protein